MPVCDLRDFLSEACEASTKQWISTDSPSGSGMCSGIGSNESL